MFKVTRAGMNHANFFHIASCCDFSVFNGAAWLANGDHAAGGQ